MIIIVDYGLGNLGSIQNMLKKIGYSSEISGNLEQVAAASKLILPGVGAFDNGMQNLNQAGLTDVLNKKVIADKTPILGICLGMQLMTGKSEEGIEKGLGWIEAETIKFSFNGPDQKLSIPHMGWEYVNVVKQSKLFDGIKDQQRYYFVHSYFVKASNEQDVLLTSKYGNDFVSAFEKENILGVQFHPEKSHRFGMDLLRNFVKHY